MNQVGMESKPQGLCDRCRMVCDRVYLVPPGDRYLCAVCCDAEKYHLAEIVEEMKGRLDNRPVVHFLKTWPKYFEETIRGIKGFEYRKNDRGFRAGDRIISCEYAPVFKELTGRRASLLVLNVWDRLPGMRDGFVIMDCMLQGVHFVDPRFPLPPAELIG